MNLERADLDPWVLFIALMALVTSIWISRDVIATHQIRSSRINGAVRLVAAASWAFLMAGPLVGFAASAPPLIAFLCLSAIVNLLARNLSTSGTAWLAIDVFGLLIGWFWSALLLVEAGLPPLVQALTLTLQTAAQFFLVLKSLERFAREAVLTHAHWREPIAAPPDAASHYRPRVSIHLPCYAEPPEVVKQTMNRLAALDYDNFEVLVCDNNTKDEALWRPLEQHVRVLNRRAGREIFRFFHVAPLAGAKAGALNYLLKQMDPNAELVAVVDADYYSEPGFLARLVPFFQDPRIAYLQTPHDYREYAGSSYLTGCYWEYMPNNKVDMLGVHEYGGAFTIGTMCLLRARALKDVGGWAEWCLTEDSEVSVRLRAAGYRGIYIGETFGRGLIPATFEDYKKQRFRWTAGPVQQLVRHWRLFLPQPWSTPMAGWTKLLEVLRCLAPLQSLLALVFGLVALGTISTAVLIGELPPIAVPNLAWLILPLAITTHLVRTWHRYRLSGCRRIGEMIQGELARASLTYVVLSAGLAGLSNKPLAWNRTPKFGKGSSMLASFASVQVETVLGIIGLCLAVALLFFHFEAGDPLGMLFALGVATLAASFLCAPYMAWLSYRDQSRLSGGDTSCSSWEYRIDEASELQATAKTGFPSY
ncbi:glycosyltransferase [Novosphingobium album (ex Hu et al. 2023)]|uniref:Glycosyltransferase n=1 Tax=Novosphingobium album (ex Hu et al. 2023) TaxID=2930093 RepID=A0ABT0B5I2_9SPHN|nr:glycosyltransferase [Novosphingobium album (ex Hu et al. 2023)]MCJ2180304.1 glycosyltransferase [Novosphingobium album (ex Hu et al. 2023)]